MFRLLKNKTWIGSVFIGADRLRRSLSGTSSLQPAFIRTHEVSKISVVLSGFFQGHFVIFWVHYCSVLSLRYMPR